MNEWWQSLEQRERYFVGGLGAFLVVFLFYMLLLDPLIASAAEYREKVDVANEDLAYMQRVAPALKANANQPVTNGCGRGPLPVTVDRASTRFGVKPDSTQAVGDDGLRVRIVDTSFDAIVGLLGNLNAQSCITVESANVRPADKPGTVKATFTLRRTP